MDIKTFVLDYLQSMSNALHPCTLKDQIDQVLVALPLISLNNAGKLHDSLGFSLDATPIGEQRGVLANRLASQQHQHKHQDHDHSGKKLHAALTDLFELKNQDAPTVQAQQKDRDTPKLNHQYAQSTYSNSHLHPQLSPIQHIRLTILTQTEQGKATAQSLAQTIWKPNLSIQTIAQNDFHVLSMLSEWVLTGQSHAIDEPPHCTVQTAQTNNDDSSPNVDPSHSQQPI